MSRVTSWIFSSLVFISLSSCALGSKNPEAELPPVMAPVIQVFPYDYDRVWRAAQKALAKYPIRVNNIEVGRLETEVLRGDKVWRAAHETPKVQPGLRYQILIQMVRGQTLNGRASTEVSVEKTLSIEKNFFADEKRLPSDGLEEEALLYRIDRELTIERAMDKAYEKNQL